MTIMNAKPLIYAEYSPACGQRREAVSVEPQVGDVAGVLL
jgi:hypothetical protein